MFEAHSSRLPPNWLQVHQKKSYIHISDDTTSCSKSQDQTPIFPLFLVLHQQSLAPEYGMVNWHTLCAIEAAFTNRRRFPHIMATKTQVTIEAEPRTVQGKQVRQLRRQGLLPARIYGHGDSVNIQLDERTFARLRETHQTAGLVMLKVAGAVQPETVLIRHMEHEPKTGDILHIDFIRVRMNELLQARVPLHLVGEAPIAKETGGMLLPLVEAVDIECLPGNLPEAVTLDVSQLTSFDVVLHASDITLPEGVTLRIAQDEPVVKVQPPRISEEPTPTVAAAAEPAAPVTEGA